MKCMSHRCVQWESSSWADGRRESWMLQDKKHCSRQAAPPRWLWHPAAVEYTPPTTGHWHCWAWLDKARARHCHAMLRVHAHVLGSTRSPTRKNAECACRGLHLWCGQWTCGAVPHSQYSSRGRLDTISIRTPALSFFKKKVYPVCDSTSARPACNYCACTSTPAC
jgi:hypothetical protein